jgi:hypothetical protein
VQPNVQDVGDLQVTLMTVPVRDVKKLLMEKQPDVRYDPAYTDGSDHWFDRFYIWIGRCRITRSRIL